MERGRRNLDRMDAFAGSMPANGRVRRGSRRERSGTNARDSVPERGFRIFAGLPAESAFVVGTRTDLPFPLQRASFASQREERELAGTAAGCAEAYVDRIRTPRSLRGIGSQVHIIADFGDLAQEHTITRFAARRRAMTGSHFPGSMAKRLIVGSIR